MNTTTMTTKGEDIMTDYQFRTIIKMVLGILRKTDDVQAVIDELENLLPEEKE